MFRLLIGICLLACLQTAAGECANACNGHGKCTSYDMCICNRNWQAADCSERVCQFGLAHVDTPKGDLDGSGGITNANEIVVENNYVYPYGTTEQFPQMQNTDLETLTDTAHYYMECSNKGRCDRSSGECQCFDGYDGVACQRASCPGYPNSCSGHGVCKSIRQLAESDNGNVYRLWDKDATMGCECDSSYFGADCSQRRCKFGVDPLYLDDAATVKYAIYDFATLTTKTDDAGHGLASLFTDGHEQPGEGKWSIRFYDNFGEDWVTAPIVAGATCQEIEKALEDIPNDVVPHGSIECTKTSFLNGTETSFTNAKQYYDAQNPTYRLHYKMAIWEAITNPEWGELSQATATTLYNDSYSNSTTQLSGHIYRIKFYGNPGAFQEPEIELYLDGTRPSLISPGHKVITKVWTDGQQGEYSDYFADYCDGVTVTVAQQAFGVSYLTGFSAAEKNKLKKCLGSSDFDDLNNIDVYNWDHGSRSYPHLIKLVRTVTTYNDGGYYAAVWFDSSEQWDNAPGVSGTFKLLNPFFAPDAVATDNYNVYTTKGTLALTSKQSEVAVSFASKRFFTTNVTYDLSRTSSTVGKFYDGDLSCERGYDASIVSHCLDRGDLFTYLNWKYPQYNPPHINLYTAKRLFTGPYQYSVSERFPAAVDDDAEMHYLTHMITSDLSANWGVSVGGDNPNRGMAGAANFNVYKFTPASRSTYTYVAECANRGLCDRDSGICKCFPGYTSDACELQSSLAL